MKLMTVGATILLFFGLFLLVGVVMPAQIQRLPHSTVVVEARAKTENVQTPEDAADDTAIYINEDHPERSLIIGTDKNSGLSVYNLSGKRIQEFPDGELNNVDIRYGFMWGDRLVALVSAGNRTSNTIDLYFVDPRLNKLERLPGGQYKTGIEIYGSCMYKNIKQDQIYIFGNSKDGEVVQWKVVSSEGNPPGLEQVRAFDVGSQVEGCVADDLYARFYIGEEQVGIWQYGADPEDQDERKLIDSTGPEGHLVADVEGLTLYRTQSKGYLLASSQGEGAYTIYSRKSGKYVGKFQVNFEGTPVRDTDGIEATSHGLGEKYPKGLVVVQDGSKSHDRQSFKLVSWQDLALSFFPPLHMVNYDQIISPDDDN